MKDPLTTPTVKTSPRFILSRHVIQTDVTLDGTVCLEHWVV